jgi:hypothetical protein
VYTNWDSFFQVDSGNCTNYYNCAKKLDSFPVFFFSSALSLLSGLDEFESLLKCYCVTRDRVRVFEDKLFKTRFLSAVVYRKCSDIKRSYPSVSPDTIQDRH